MNSNQVKSIVLGHVDEFLNRNEDFYNKRIQICRRCPLMIETAFGKVCDSKRYLDPKTMQSSYKFTPGSIKGCGCRLDAKTRRPDEHCPAKLW